MKTVLWSLTLVNAREVKGITKKFGDFVAVDSISFEVGAGEIFGFLGANGAGKSTAMRMLCGLLEPTSGEARVAGFDIYRQREQIKKSIGYMSQKFSLYGDLTVAENIKFWGGLYGLTKAEIRAKKEEIVEKLEMRGWENSFAASLPMGWKQKLAFSISIMHSPKIVFLDEPTGGVDPIVRRKFWEEIYDASRRSITVFVTTHYMDEAEYCDRASIMVDGQIRALGTPAELKKKFGRADMDGVFKDLARGAQRKDA